MTGRYPHYACHLISAQDGSAVFRPGRLYSFREVADRGYCSWIEQVGHRRSGYTCSNPRAHGNMCTHHDRLHYNTPSVAKQRHRRVSSEQLRRAQEELLLDYMRNKQRREFELPPLCTGDFYALADLHEDRCPRCDTRLVNACVDVCGHGACMFCLHQLQERGLLACPYCRGPVSAVIRLDA